MARDFELIEIVRSGTHSLIFETYTWEPWAVSLGKHQSIDVINIDKAYELGIDVVWRPTGGRAILHADELTYCVAVRGEPRNVFRQINAIIHRAIDKIVPGALSGRRTQTNLRQFYASATPLGQACFASSIKDELMHNNKKVVGSAQRVIDGVVLQHGSILCGHSHELLADILALNESDRLVIRQQLRCTSITLSEIAGTHIDPLTVAEEIEQIEIEHLFVSDVHNL